MKTSSALLLAALLAAFAVNATAQWQWIDRDGRKVFSDQAPPPDIPERNILRQPGGRARAAEPAPAASAASAAPAPVAPLRPASRDGVLEERKKQADAEAEAKRKAEEEKYQKTRADNCARARQAKASLDSGMRIARINAAGERVFMDEQARAAEERRIQDIIRGECD